MSLIVIVSYYYCIFLGVGVRVGVGMGGGFFSNASDFAPFRSIALKLSRIAIDALFLVIWFNRLIYALYVSWLAAIFMNKLYSHFVHNHENMRKKPLTCRCISRSVTRTARVVLHVRLTAHTYCKRGWRLELTKASGKPWGMTQTPGPETTGESKVVFCVQKR